ncbi:MAG: 5-oxoprolinase [Dehalococcoidia bacterium]|nr:5-oxoprolinase [Dehalococcoidia bacterium]
MAVDPISLEVIKNLLISIADEMGVTLQRTSYSPNIKERKDFSCAVFDKSGQMVAQAAHQPVHLGAMPASVEAALQKFGSNIALNDIIILNDPYMGGTHLPDITMLAPVFIKKSLIGYVANRGHHADVGGMTPGSLPLSTELYQEGLIIPPIKLSNNESINTEILDLICRNSRTPDERRGDLSAQIASIKIGARRLEDITKKYGVTNIAEHMEAILEYSEIITRNTINGIPNGIYEAEDFMDDDGLTEDSVKIQVTVTVQGDQIHIDFTGTDKERPGCINAPKAVTTSACLYVIRCIVGEEAPANQGCLRPVTITLPEGTVTNPLPQRGVAGGNVETSQRITDILLSAFAKALPELIPASSQGTMNNILIGGHHHHTHSPFVYYETIAGGMGGTPNKSGESAIHSHMTNTMNTPIEALEFAFPLRIKQYAIRKGSGGQGLHSGGDGVIRDYEFLSPARVTILSERRKNPPPGALGGDNGETGQNILYRSGFESFLLKGKETLDVEPGDIISIQTPGGGAWGQENKD